MMAWNFPAARCKSCCLPARCIATRPLSFWTNPPPRFDPLAESRLYQTYAETMRGKSALFISHRLASTRFCDRILLLENGAIVEEGTHESLLKMGGRYAQLFETQARWYRDPPAGEEGAP